MDVRRTNIATGHLDPGENWVVCVAPDPKALMQIDRAAIGDILGILPYEAGQLLAGTLPRVVAVGEQADTRQRVSSLLREGLQALAVPVATVFAPDEIPVVRSLRLDEGALTAVRPDGSSPGGAVDMVVAVRLGEDSVTTTEKKTRKLSLGKTLATGMPMSKKVVTKTVTHSMQEMFGAYLFTKNSHEPVAWLDGNRADYAWLGENKAVVPLPNFGATRRWLTEQLPALSWDDSLFRPGKRPVPGSFAGWYRLCSTDLAIVRMIRLMAV